MRIAHLLPAFLAFNGIAQVVKDGETGFLVPPRDVSALAEAVIRLIKNNKLRQEMGENASKWVKGKFSLDH